MRPKVNLSASECHERLPLLVGLFPLCMSAHKPLVVTISIAKPVITVKLIGSAKCLFTSRAASFYLKQSLLSLSVRSAQDELKPKKKKV